MNTQAFAAPSGASFNAHRRIVGELERLCALPPGHSAERCGQIECTYFDSSMGRCGLLVWDVAGNIPYDSLRWLVDHRRFIPDANMTDEALAARCASL